MNSQKVKKELNQLKNAKRAAISRRFFKTGKGEYGEGDRFLGIRMGGQRHVAKKYRNLNLRAIQSLLNSSVHEYRMVGLLILNEQFKKADQARQEEITDFYIRNAKRVNNWDLVDLSAPHILGGYLLERNRKILYRLAKSKNLWERRISIMATFTFIRENQFRDTLKIAKTLLGDEHDLIHKAVGWMLRELGKRDQAVEEKFLCQHYQTMPRTMLRYAIEKFSPNKRKFYLSK